VRRKGSTRPEITSPELGLIVRVEREAQGVSQAQLAERAGMRIPQLSSLENGLNCEIKFYEMCAIALGYRSAAALFMAQGADRDKIARQVKAELIQALKAMK
jgi:transcriptional regulator with XRE-family HTH domain